jgi:hypothetical protein
MTLIELLAASVLAALLAAALVGVLQSIHRQRQAVADSLDSEVWTRRLEARLRWDLMNARQMHVRPDRMVLIGYGSRDPVTGVATHAPSEVIYSVTQAGTRTWLVRTERDLGAKGTDPTTRELLCAEIGALYAGRPEEELHDLLRKSTGPPVLSPVPARLRCVLTGVGSKVCLNFVVVHTGGRP